MRVLVACEESQEVCKAFRAKGHEAYSCDIIPCSGGHPEWHIKDDVLKHLGEGWDMMIGHPTCTYLCNSGVCHLYKKDGAINHERWILKEKASDFFYKLWDADIPKICLENPIPHKYADLPAYTQIIHPWMFGHTEQKATCLWLKGLPLLKETNNVYNEMMTLPKRERERLHHLPPSKDRAKIRSKTFVGIAEAMATQWGAA